MNKKERKQQLNPDKQKCGEITLLRKNEVFTIFLLPLLDSNYMYRLYMYMYIAHVYM